MRTSISTPMSDSDISKYIRNVVKYEDFITLNHSVILNNLPFIILYQSSDSFGHWTLLHKTVDGIEFFDSYGFKPDEQFSMIPAEFQLPHGLVDFLITMSSKYQINYNQFHLQNRIPGVNTCGRWCILRSMLNCPISVFAKTVKNVSSKVGVTPDELTTIVIP